MRSTRRQLLDDRLFLWRARAARKPFFHAGRKSPPLAEHLHVIDLELPRLNLGRATFKADTLAGPLSGAIHVLALGPPTAPVVIYHHDAGEIPVTRMLADVFPPNLEHGLTVLVIEAPFHDSPHSFKGAGESLVSFLAMQAVAIEATERLLQLKRVADAPLRVVTGYGQGGYIANLHHVIYNSSDIYIPFMAGAAQAEMFLSSWPTDARARHKAGELRELLNFDTQWAERNNANVYPVLGSADLVNRFDAQARSYGDTPIEVWPLGHVATAKSPERMRKKILRHIKEHAGEHQREAPAPRPVALFPRFRARG